MTETPRPPVLLTMSPSQWDEIAKDAEESPTYDTDRLVSEVRALSAALQEARAERDKLTALLPRIAESLTNDTLTETPDQLSDVDVPCACEDCDGLRIDALKAVWKILQEPPR